MINSAARQIMPCAQQSAIAIGADSPTQVIPIKTALATVGSGNDFFIGISGSVVFVGPFSSEGCFYSA